MSAALLAEALTFVRGRFTRAEVATVQAYGGEFNSGETTQLSYNCPAIFITVLGWQRAAHGMHLTGRSVRAVRMAAFVAFKHPSRDQRMLGALNLADKLAIALRAWVPANTDPLYVIAGIEGDASCENLYGRDIDAKGQALWLVDWEQCIKPLVPPEQLFDLIAIDITDHTRKGEPTAAPAPGPAVLTVTEDVQFVPDT